MSKVFYTNAHQHQLLRVIPDLIRCRELLLDLVWKEVRVRYRYTIMGFLWAILEPLAMMLILTLVFSYAFRARIEEYGIEAGREVAVFILSGLIPWQFFSTALSSATRSLVDNRTLVQKVHFPREVVPIAAVGVALVNLVIGAFLLLAVFVILMNTLPGSGLLWLPIIFAIQLILVLGLGLLLSAVNAAYRDVAYMVDAALLFGFYATPIFYPPSMVEEALPRFYSIYMLNPMAGLVTAYRNALFDNQPPTLELLGWPALVAVVFLILGAIVFRKKAPFMADNL